ncbi:MAG TPA: hypothetical protein VFV19_11535 [Candidatus Polarisedimenticolaceae bacterium]|nr:hypothetical protein [Candidatus Polarisedimenticolaceae bacterium]
MTHAMSRLALAVLALSLVGTPAPAGEDAAKPAPARKVLVVAKVKEEAKRRALEDAAAAELKKRGVEPTLGSDVLTEADFASEEVIRHKVESLGVDGVIGYVPLSVDETVRTSSAHVSIGIGGGGGGMGMFVGASAPIGGSTTVLRKVKLRARYFARPFGAPLWEKTYIETLKDDVSGLVKSVASDTVNTLKKKKFIPAK